MIEDVQAGKVDMGWVGARAFDAVGVTSFQALVAPFLVDSYELQDRVFQAGIPAADAAGPRRDRSSPASACCPDRCAS